MTSDPGPAVVGDVVVVLSFRGRADTLRCVESLRTGSPRATVVVVDNGSDDGVLDEVTRRWPEVVTLQTGSNLGFTGGMNHGIRWALGAGASSVTVLNNDTVVPAGAVARLADVASSGVAVSPVVTYLDDPSTVWFGGGTVDEDTGLARHLAPGELPDPGPDGLRSTTVLAGCSVTASATTWHRAGLFDERFFLLFEDSEWSLRAARLGIPLVVDTKTTVAHRVSASFGGPMHYLGGFYYARNGLLFVESLGPDRLRRSLRLLRRHAAAPVTGAARRRQWAESARLATAAALGVGAYAVRRFGRAPALVERLATRWSATGTPVAR